MSTSYEGAFIGAVALDASAEAITEVGTDGSLSTQSLKGEEWYEYGWAAQIRRSLVIGDTLFTLSERGLKGSDIDTLDDTVLDRTSADWIGLGLVDLRRPAPVYFVGCTLYRGGR